MESCIVTVLEDEPTDPLTLEYMVAQHALEALAVSTQDLEDWVGWWLCVVLKILQPMMLTLSQEHKDWLC